MKNLPIDNYKLLCITETYERKDMNSKEHDLVIDRRTIMKMGSVGLAAMIAGCSSGESSGNSVDGGGDSNENTTSVLNVGLDFSPQNLDPAYAQGPTSQLMVSLLVEPVVYFDPDANLKAGAATEIPRPTDNGRTYEYTLRDDLTFHNGDTVTAEDFKSSLEWQENPENISPLEGRLPFYDSAEIVDERTLRINLTESFGSFNTWMAEWFRGIVPKGSRGRAEEGGGSSGGATTDLSTDLSGAGSGPFKFVEWQSGNYLRVEANEDYHLDGIPKVAEIKFTFITEASTRLAQLKSKSIDLTNFVPPTNADQMTDDPNIDLLEFPGNLWHVVYTNLQSTDGSNPMANRNNRRAVMYALNREEIVNEIFRNRAEIKNTMWYRGTDWSSPQVDDMTLYNPEKARDELEKAGNPDGFDMKMLTISRDVFSRYAVKIQSQLSNVGINAEIIPQEESAHFTRIYGENDWHAAATYGGINIPNPMSLMEVIYANNRRNHHHWFHASEDLPDKWEPSGPPAPNDANGNFSNGHEWFVNYLQDTLAEPDLDRQKKRVYRMQEYLVENAIGPHVCFRNSLQAKQNYVKGYQTGTWVDEYRNVTLDK
jgi:ABC-type transport system substrate-binding protein